MTAESKLKQAQVLIGEALTELNPAPPPPSPSSVIVGVNGGSTKPAVVGMGIKSERLEFNPGLTTYSQHSLAESRANGFTNQTVIVGNVDDGVKLVTINLSAWVSAAVAQAKAVPGVLLLECVNEPQFKGGVKDPKTYAAMYVALKKALLAAGVTTPLGFTLFGNFQEPNGEWKKWDWLIDAVAAQPELPKLIDAYVHHTYGRAGENLEGNLGTAALEQEYAEAQLLNCPAAPVYCTELGFEVTGVKSWRTVVNAAEQAAQIAAVLAKLKSLPMVKGVWPYAVKSDPWTLAQVSLEAIAAA